MRVMAAILAVMSFSAIAEDRGIAFTINIDQARMEVWGVGLSDCIKRPTIDLAAKFFAIECSSRPSVLPFVGEQEIIRYGGELGQPPEYSKIQVVVFDTATMSEAAYASCDAIAGHVSLNLFAMLQQPAQGRRFPSYHFHCAPIAFRSGFE